MIKYGEKAFYILIIFIIVFLCFYPIRYILNTYNKMITCPHAIEFTEGEHLLSTVKIYNLENPYPKWNSYPYITTIYGPTYYIASALMIPLVGQRVMAGRLITMISVMSISFLIYLLVLQKSRDKMVSIIVSLLFFSSPLVLEWGSTFRGDYFSIFLSFLGLYFFIKYGNTKKRNWSIVPFLIAVYYKASYLFGPISCSIILFLNNRGRRRITVPSIYWGMFFSAYILIYIALNLLTKGQYHIDTTLTQTMSPNVRIFEVPQLLCRWGNYFKEDYSIIILCIIFGFYSLFHKQKFNVLIFYYFLSLIGSLHIGFRDSGANHLLEIHASSFIVLGLFFSYIREVNTKRFLCNSIFFILLILVCLTRPIRPNSPLINYGISSSIYGSKLDKLIRETPDPIIIDSEVDYQITNKKSVLFEPYGMSLMKEAGVWDPEKSEIIKDIRERKFKLFIYWQRFTSGKILKEFLENYMLVEIIGGNAYIYRPIPDIIYKEMKQLYSILSNLDVWQKYPFQKVLKKYLWEKNIVLCGFSEINIQECEKFISQIMDNCNIIGIYRPFLSNTDFIVAIYTRDQAKFKKFLSDNILERKIKPIFANCGIICTEEYNNGEGTYIVFQPLFNTDGYRKINCTLDNICDFSVCEETKTDLGSNEPCIWLKEGAGEGKIIYRISSFFLIEKITLETFPRILNNNDGVTRLSVDYSIDGKNFANVYGMRSNKEKKWSDIGVKRVDSINVNSKVVYIKFVLKGSRESQIWSSSVYPMKFKLIFNSDKV